MDPIVWILIAVFAVFCVLLVLNAVFGWHIRFWSRYGGPGSLADMGMASTEVHEGDDVVTTYRGSPWGVQVELKITYLDVQMRPREFLHGASYSYQRYASWSYEYNAAFPAGVGTHAPGLLDDALEQLYAAGWPLPVAAPYHLACNGAGISFQFKEQRWGRARSQIRYEIEFASALVETITNLAQQKPDFKARTHRATRREARKLRKDKQALAARRKR